MIYHRDRQVHQLLVSHRTIPPPRLRMLLSSPYRLLMAMNTAAAQFPRLSDYPQGRSSLLSQKLSHLLSSFSYSRGHRSHFWFIPVTIPGSGHCRRAFSLFSTECLWIHPSNISLSRLTLIPMRIAWLLGK